MTGGNSGIGRAIALRAAAEGARVAIAGRDRTKGGRVLGELKAGGADAAFFSADLSEAAQAADMVGAVAAHFGGLDVVVNNAGAGARRSSIEAKDNAGERLRKLMRANFEAAENILAQSSIASPAGASARLKGRAAGPERASRRRPP